MVPCKGGGGQWHPPLREGGWDFRDEGSGLRYRLLKVVSCGGGGGNQGHPSLREKGFGILEKGVGVLDTDC